MVRDWFMVTVNIGRDSEPCRYLYGLSSCNEHLGVFRSGSIHFAPYLMKILCLKVQLVYRSGYSGNKAEHIGSYQRQVLLISNLVLL